MFSLHFPLAPALSASYVALVTAVTQTVAATQTEVSIAAFFQSFANWVGIAVAGGVFIYLWTNNGDMRELKKDVKGLIKSVEGLTKDVNDFRTEQAEHRVKIENLERERGDTPSERRKTPRRYSDQHSHDDG